MANPLAPQIIRPDPARDVRARLEAARVQHADAVLGAYDLLQALYDHGALDFLRGLTGAGGDIVTRLAQGANTPEGIAALRNLISLARIAGSVDPEILHGVAELLARAPAPAGGKPGLLRTLRKLGSPESRRAMGAAVYGLQVFGRVLISRQAIRK